MEAPFLAMSYKISSLPNRLWFTLAFTLGSGTISNRLFASIFLSPRLSFTYCLFHQQVVSVYVDTGGYGPIWCPMRSWRQMQWDEHGGKTLARSRKCVTDPVAHHPPLKDQDEYQFA